MNGRTLEHWISPKARAKRKEYIDRYTRDYWKAIKADPKRHTAYNKRAAGYAATARRTKPETEMLVKARVRAKQKSLPFDLTLDDITIPTVCPVLGIPIQRQDVKPNDHSPELDRIVNALGYVKGNVVVVSRRANRIKNDATIDELEQIVRFYRALKGETK